MMRRPILTILALLALARPAPAPAQLAPLTVPRGLLRLDFGGRFDNWDRRFLDGTKQEAAGDFIRNPLTGAFFAPLATDQALIQQVTGMGTGTLSLGASSASMLVNVGTAGIGLAYGLTRRLTVFGTVPIVRVRVQNTFALDSTSATAGFNPVHPLFGDASRAAQTALFLGQLEAALGTISQNLETGVYDSDPQAKALAEQTLAAGNDIDALFLQATFLPLEGTAGADAILAPIEVLRTGITTLAGPGFSALPAFPATRISGEAFEDFVTATSGPIEAEPFQPPILQYIGDIEVGAAYAWLEHLPSAGFGIRSVLQGLVRLRTGKLDRPHSLFDLGTSDRQPDIQGDLVTDFIGGGWGARATLRYVYQLSGRLTRRVTSADQPFAPASTTAALERDPGEVLELGLEPYVRIAPTMALVAGVRRWSKRADSYSYVRNQAPIDGTSLDVLAAGTAGNATVFSAGLSYAHGGRRKDGSTGFPMDALLRFEQVIESSSGRVPATQSIVAQLRLYRKLF